VKRIALITHGGVDIPGTGVRVPFLIELIERISKSYDTLVFSPRPGADYPAESQCGFARIRFVKADRMQPPIIKAASLWRAVVSEHRRRPFELLHGIWAIPSGTLAVLLAHRLRIRAAVSLHGAETANLPSIGYGHMSSPLPRQMTRWTCKRADAVIVLSRHQRDALRTWGMGNTNVSLIPPGAASPFYGLPAKPFPEGVVRILHVANLTRVKDQGTLLRAFADILKEREARLRIVGGDYMDGAVQGLANELGILPQVEFRGYIPHEQMPQEYGWADLLMHTSLHEAGCIVVSEAAAANVLICGTSVGPIADLAGSAAVGVLPGDFRALAEETLAILRDRERFLELRARARTWAEKFTMESTASELSRVYETLAAR